MRKNRRKTRFIVYVGKSDLGKPDSLCDATMAHLVRKVHPIDKRKQFLAQFIKAVGVENKLEVIDAWVQVRDVATFPMQQQSKNRGLENMPADSVEAEEANVDELIIPKEEQREDSEAEGGVPVDDGADGESESGTSSE